MDEAGLCPDLKKNAIEEEVDDASLKCGLDQKDLCSLKFFVPRKQHLPLNVYFLTFSATPPSHVNGIPWGQMTKEMYRLSTFSKYPHNSQCRPILLARQGFLFIGRGEPDDDTVMCVYCLKAAKGMDMNTSIEELHFHHCRIFSNINYENDWTGSSDDQHVQREDSEMSTRTGHHQRNESQILPMDLDNSQNRPPSVLASVDSEAMEMPVTQRDADDISIGSITALGTSHDAAAVATLSREVNADYVLLDLLQKENEILQARLICTLCKKQRVEHVFLPCGHVVCCQDCLELQSICVVCRQGIQGTCRIYLS